VAIIAQAAFRIQTLLPTPGITTGKKTISYRLLVHAIQQMSLI
jgi:hypothetical protein